jgi:hypothetical protein
MLNDNEASVASHTFIAVHLYVKIHFKLPHHNKSRDRFFAHARTTIGENQ